MSKNYYKIVLYYGYKHRCDFICGLTRDEAYEFCDMYKWTYEDENGFVWNMEVEVEE